MAQYGSDIGRWGRKWVDRLEISGEEKIKMGRLLVQKRFYR